MATYYDPSKDPHAGDPGWAHIEGGQPLQGRVTQDETSAGDPYGSSQSPYYQPRFGTGQLLGGGSSGYYDPGPMGINLQGQAYDFNRVPLNWGGYYDLSGNKIYTGITQNTGVRGPTFVPMPRAPQQGYVGGEQGMSGPPMYARIPEMGPMPGRVVERPSSPPISNTISIDNRRMPNLPQAQPMSAIGGSYSGMPTSPLPNVGALSSVGGPHLPNIAALPGLNMPNLGPTSGGGYSPSSGPGRGGMIAGGGGASSPAQGQAPGIMPMSIPPSSSPSAQPAAAPRPAIQPGMVGPPQMPGNMPMGGGIQKPMLQGQVSMNRMLPGGGAVPQGAPSGGGQAPSSGQNPLQKFAEGALGAVGNVAGAIGNALIPPAEAKGTTPEQGLVPPPTPYAVPTAPIGANYGLDLPSMSAEQIKQITDKQMQGASLITNEVGDRIAKAMKAAGQNMLTFGTTLNDAYEKAGEGSDKTWLPLLEQNQREMRRWLPEDVKTGRPQGDMYKLQQQLQENMMQDQQEIRNLTKGLNAVQKPPILTVPSPDDEEAYKDYLTRSTSSQDEEGRIFDMGQAQKRAAGIMGPIRNIAGMVRHPLSARTPAEQEMAQAAANKAAVQADTDRQIARRQISLQNTANIYTHLENIKGATRNAFVDAAAKSAVSKAAAQASVLAAADTLIKEQGNLSTEVQMQATMLLQEKAIQSLDNLRQATMKFTANNEEINRIAKKGEIYEKVMNVLIAQHKAEIELMKTQQQGVLERGKMYVQLHNAWQKEFPGGDENTFKNTIWRGFLEAEQELHRREARQQQPAPVAKPQPPEEKKSEAAKPEPKRTQQTGYVSKPDQSELKATAGKL